jgi:MFS family permease
VAGSAPESGEEDNDIKGTQQYGRIIGGKYIEQYEADEAADNEFSADNELAPLMKLPDVDIPLTLTEKVIENDKEYIVLLFAHGDKENPFNWSPAYKMLITTILNLMTLFIGLATTAYSSGINSMAEDLNSTAFIGQFGLFAFNFACALAPLFLAPFCEMVGRKIVYVGGFFCFSVLFIGLALAQSMSTIIGLRVLLGLFGCIGTILVGGTFDDMYEPQHRGQPMAAFSWIAILGTVGAPIYAGFINMTIGWRWIEGVQGIANVPLLIAIVVLFTETRGGVALHKRAKLVRKATGDERYVATDDIATPSVKVLLKNSSVKAIQMLITEPVVFAFGLWIGFTWFVTFMFLSVIPITYQEKRGWNEGVAGLPYISLCIGCTLGWIANQWQMKKYNRIVADETRNVTPEDRLYGAMYGAIWLPIGLFIYSFTQYGYVHWIAPTIALAPISFGIYFVFEATYSYTADCYGTSASSAIAGQGFLRNTLGAVSPLFASQFFHNVGSQYAGLILSIAGTVLCMIPFVAYKWGPVLRARSKRALVY